MGFQHVYIDQSQFAMNGTGMSGGDGTNSEYSVGSVEIMEMGTDQLLVAVHKPFPNNVERSTVSVSFCAC